VDRLLTVGPAARALLDREAVAWTERVLFTPLAATRADSLRVVAIGYHPTRDPAVFPRTSWRVEGALPAERGLEVAMSHRVARLLGLERGGHLVLQVRTRAGAINALEVTVTALVTTGNAALDRLGLFVPQALARQLVNTELPSHVAVKLRQRGDAAPFAAKLRTALGGEAEVVTWRDETAELVRLQELRRRALNLVMFVLMAVGALGIANTVLMATHERVREIGTLRALGMSEGGVLRLFLGEGLMIGLAGSLLGALWGGGLVAYWARHPLDLTKAFANETSGAVPLSALVYTRLAGEVIAGAVVLGVVVAVLASLYPARMASRLAPADAVRGS
jgi:putative ABC transport system permease protein